LIIVGRHEYGDGETRAFVHRLRDEHVPDARFPDGVRVYAGGAPAQGADFLGRTYGVFPWVVLAVLALTFVALLWAFRSLLLPLKAVLLNVLTIAAVYGLLVAVFQWGLGHDVEAWVPVFLFAVLFGLSMDYEVFLVTRMREAWDEEPDNDRAVTRGLERTGRIVTAAALIMVIVFCGFIVGRIDALRQLGFGLAVGVLIDATLVRAILVPSLMAVLGRWNWWLPARIARIVDLGPTRPS
jgi:RND superfamily putative drug exporter